VDLLLVRLRDDRADLRPLVQRLAKGHLARQVDARGREVLRDVLMDEMRLPELQHWPTLKWMPKVTASAALSRSASGKIACGFLPPEFERDLLERADAA
jgi:hypothetical protein